MLLGCIADDLTGATDLCLTLSRGGMRTVQVMGVPGAKPLPDADAVVIALKSRTIPARDAVAQSLASTDALLAAGARQLFFKYCSTFDSTDAGNIGPVADALLTRLDATITIACPAFPTNGRTVYQGHLFVGTELLSDSSMRDHPLTPMRDSSLVRVLGRQTSRPVGLIAHAIVAQGADAIRRAVRHAEQRAIGMLIVDALSDADLIEIGRAAADLRLVTGGSGVAIGLPDNFRRAGLLATSASGLPRRSRGGRAAVLAGSCSAATLRQVAEARAAGMASLAILPSALADGSQTVETVAAWAVAQDPERPILVYSTAPPQDVKEAQERLGRDHAAALVERTLGNLAATLVRQGFSRLIVAGGETSGAVVAALAIGALAIGPEIDPGVPWTLSLDGPDVALALKSGNFGGPRFFLEAWEKLP